MESIYIGFEQGPQVVSETFEQRLLSGRVTEAAAREEQSRNTLDIVARGEDGEQVITKSQTGEDRIFPNLGAAIEWANKNGGLIYSQVEGARKLMTGQTVDEILAKK